MGNAVSVAAVGMLNGLRRVEVTCACGRIFSDASEEAARAKHFEHSEKCSATAAPRPRAVEKVKP